GYGPLAEGVVKEATNTENIIYLGFVNPRDIPLYTCLSDAVLYGFDPRNPNAKYSAPNKLFEALAAGKAIITGDFGEIGKIVKEEACGIVLNDCSVNAWGRAFDLLSLNSRLKQYQTNALWAARRRYNWNKAEAVLIAEYYELSQSIKRM
ncbi:MAG: glycosyltransferase, partial [Candidatus Hodarchaeota archaeon]